MNRSRFARNSLGMALALAATGAVPQLAGADPGANGNAVRSAVTLDDNDSRAQRGREIVPPGVILNLRGKQRNMVWLGSYVVNTSGCADCHTHPTYSPGGTPSRDNPSGSTPSSTCREAGSSDRPSPHLT